MKIVSTNIGEPRTLPFNGKEVTTGIFKFPVEEGIFLGAEDVEKDHVIDRRYHGGIDKACYLYSADHYEYWQKLYPELEMPWGMFGENLTVEGLHEAQVNIGDVFSIGDVIVQATQPRQPCYKLNFRFHDKEIVRQFVDSGFSGVYVRVLEGGQVTAGTEMKRIERKESVSIQQVYTWIYASDFDPEIKRAINDPNIAASCRKDLLKRWGDLL
ncbi:MOSC domain-containing protein [Maribellus sp. YY47]|uniref:MOSC domain-containing protein n=1 Tax=Maribellus sp. YY47 TaxID=2929486 RepID=UPI00200082C2|nr:MOSC domain-containing protein [Maribellus sp. YY47]MCK3684264.1 MOSC domain-containing protein [Maribellus sp. YY47]